MDKQGKILKRLIDKVVFSIGRYNIGDNEDAEWFERVTFLMGLLGLTWYKPQKHNKVINFFSEESKKEIHRLKKSAFRNGHNCSDSYGYLCKLTSLLEKKEGDPMLDDNILEKIFLNEYLTDLDKLEFIEFIVSILSKKERRKLVMSLSVKCRKEIYFLPFEERPYRSVFLFKKDCGFLLMPRHLTCLFCP